jgi:hypothetical protein
MKKLIFSMLILFISTQLYSQSFNAGILFGVVGSQVNGDRLKGFDKAGLLAGAFVNRNLSERISLQMEMVFIQKGSRKPVTDDNSYYRLRVHYIEVPFLIRYHTLKKFIFTLGPTFGTLVFEGEDDQFGDFRNSLPFEKFELSGNFGFQYKLSEKWLFDGRYSHSITTIRPFPGVDNAFFDGGQYNELIEISLLCGF